MLSDAGEVTIVSFDRLFDSIVFDCLDEVGGSFLVLASDTGAFLLDVDDPVLLDADGLDDDEDVVDDFVVDTDVFLLEDVDDPVLLDADGLDDDSSFVVKVLLEDVDDPVLLDDNGLDDDSSFVIKVLVEDVDDPVVLETVGLDEDVPLELVEEEEDASILDETILLSTLLELFDKSLFTLASLGSF